MQHFKNPRVYKTHMACEYSEVFVLFYGKIALGVCFYYRGSNDFLGKRSTGSN